MSYVNPARPSRALTVCLAALLLASGSAAVAQPTVVATAEGQIGATPDSGDQLLGTTFESVRGQAGDVLLGGLFAFGGATPPPPGFVFELDALHATPDPTQVGGVSDAFAQVDKVTPASARSRDAADTGDYVAFSFAVDGSTPQTMAVRVLTFDESGSTRASVTLDDLPTVPDFFLNRTAVAVDDQGRATVIYGEFDGANPPVTKAQRVDAVTGLPIGGAFPVATNRFNADVALLDPAGNRLIVPTSDFGTIVGNIVDLSGATPQVLPPFAISTSAGFSNVLPAVAADPSTGAFVVAWENVTAVQGDPVNVRARRFDAQGNPVGNDFIVNTTTANAQGQPDAAVGPNGESVIVWAGDSTNPGDVLDVFAQAYDAAGQPIGGEIRVNTTTAGNQSLPAVRFLPEPDAQNRPQFAVVWRDTANDDGTQANGTGRSYKCFAIDGLDELESIFTDGFESGDTSSWSTRQP